MQRIYYIIFYFIPKKTLSFLIGALFRRAWPQPIQTFINQSFIRIYGLNMTEASQPVEDYKSLGELFIRTLKPALRPSQGEIIYPADGTMIVQGFLKEHGELIQAKGLRYSASELVLGKKQKNKQSFKQAEFYTTIYLAPYNYHRVHVPATACLVAMRYIRGTLWPVNQMFSSLVRGLFCVNERLVFEFKMSSGGKYYLVMIGAFNVGQIITPYWSNLQAELASRRSSYQGVEEKSCQFDLSTGDELGYFQFGSSVVLLFDQETSASKNWDLIAENSSIQLGTSMLKS